MKAMVMEESGSSLVCKDLPIPDPDEDQVLVKVKACGVCRTDLHILDGELTEPRLPLIPGHQIVGEVVKIGSTVTGIEMGERGDQ